MKGRYTFFLEKHHYPSDLQVGPLLGTQGGGGGELAPSGQILESTLYPHFGFASNEVSCNAVLRGRLV